MNPGDYANGMRVTGPISVRPHTNKIPFFARTILLLGSTGTGKSNFIECLSGGSLSGIAKDQLEGFTQEVTAYEVVNVKQIYPATSVFLIDAPGFADRNISELRVLELIRDWARKNLGPWGVGSISYILYFDRITDTRVPGSKKRLMSLFYSIIGSPQRTAKAVTIVTTMWDELWTDSQREKAERRFIQLQNEHWKELIDNGTGIVKFQNTQTSSAEVVRDALRIVNFKDWPGFDTTNSIHKTAFGPIVLQSLKGRIEGLQQRLRSIQDDLQDESTLSNVELVDVLSKEKEEMESTLCIFEKELLGFSGGLPRSQQRESTPGGPWSEVSSSVKGIFRRTKSRFKNAQTSDETKS